ncbi:MAG: response regulator [Okeania sp. SIO2H7]|nr:response regulator [Okeania sp. SIO2H7]
MLNKTLTRAGFEVAVASTGTIALEWLESNQTDLVLLDIIMPGIDGFEVCEMLKKNLSTRDIPIIFMTALNDIEDRVKGLSLGAVDYITKPFGQEEILARVKIHLKLRSLTKALAEKNELLEREIAERAKTEETLQERTKELQELTEELEERVEERTAEVTRAWQQFQEAKMQLMQSEKMSALGQMMAGIAHEINNPVTFIIGNINYAEEYIQDLLNLLNMYRETFPDAGEEIEREIEAIELEFLKKDLPQLIASMKQGTERINNITKSLRTFSRADTVSKVAFKLHEGIDSTLMILKHRLKANDKRPEIMVIKKYGDLPEIECYPGQLNQVFMNIIANAIDALDEGNEGRTFEELKLWPNTITITTELNEEKTAAIVRIEDNGPGMSQEVQKRIFDNLFTTKPVGKGTGLGLSISLSIIVEKHGGKLSCNSELGEGTEFAIEIPL